MTDHNLTRSRWLLASTLGLAVGIPGGLALGGPLERLVGAVIVTPLMLGISGLLLGTAQWAALRRSRLPTAALWIALTAVGFSLGFTAALVLVEKGGESLTGAPMRMSSASPAVLVVAMTVLGLVGGTLTGLSQGLALRSIPGAARTWLWSSVLGLTLGFLTGFGAASVVGGLSTIAGPIVFLVVSGLVYGAVTARALPTMTGSVQQA